jgi:hypothetical protein
MGDSSRSYERAIGPQLRLVDAHAQRRRGLVRPIPRVAREEPQLAGSPLEEVGIGKLPARLPRDDDRSSPRLALILGERERELLAMPGRRHLRRGARGGHSGHFPRALATEPVPRHRKPPTAQSEDEAGGAAGIQRTGPDRAPVLASILAEGVPEPVQVGADEHQQPAISQLDDARLSGAVVVPVSPQIHPVAPLPVLAVIVRPEGADHPARRIACQVLDRGDEASVARLDETGEVGVVAAEDALPVGPGRAAIQAANRPQLQARVLRGLSGGIVPGELVALEAEEEEDQDAVAGAQELADMAHMPQVDAWGDRARVGPGGALIPAEPDPLAVDQGERAVSASARRARSSPWRVACRGGEPSGPPRRQSVRAKRVAWSASRGAPARHATSSPAASAGAPFRAPPETPSPESPRVPRRRCRGPAPPSGTRWRATRGPSDRSAARATR